MHRPVSCRTSCKPRLAAFGNCKRNFGQQDEKEQEEAKSIDQNKMAQAKVFNVGQLLDFEWKLGVAVESNNCKKLNAPFVSILLRTLDDNGKVVSHAFELSFPEFQEFAKNFRDISNLMESL